jgi:hypothetical protein
MPAAHQVPAPFGMPCLVECRVPFAKGGVRVRVCAGARGVACAPPPRNAAAPFEGGKLETQNGTGDGRHEEVYIGSLLCREIDREEPSGLIEDGILCGLFATTCARTAS